MKNEIKIRLKTFICLFVALLIAGFKTCAQCDIMRRMPCYDFCGLEVSLTNGHPFGEGHWLVKDGQNEFEKFVFEPTRGLNTNALQYVTLNDYRWLYVHLVMAEAAGLSGDGKRFFSCGETFYSLIHVYEKHSDVLGTFTIRRIRPKLEYMLARIINDRRPSTVKLVPADIRRFLPSLSKEGVVWDESLWHSWRTRETFRRMLIVGTALEHHLRKFGHLPNSLETLDCVEQEEMKDAYGKHFLYRYKKHEWMIFSCGKETERESPWDVYVPCVGITGGYATTETCFASSFSRKRQELYKSGCLNDAYPAYRCYMRGNVVYRGDGEGTKHPID